MRVSIHLSDADRDTVHRVAARRSDAFDATERDERESPRELGQFTVTDL
ncbi:hypothetical protein [Halogranum amylolyticum]|nr:hypothetical protein [Halogranum amylolyticum]